MSIKGEILDKRWSIYIDIEGFGALYEKEDTVWRALRELMEGIYLIGTNYCPETPGRIWAHQSGDGFIIVSEFEDSSLEKPTAIAIALLRHVASIGRFAKATISEGTFSDITACYPKIIQNAPRHGDAVCMGGGLMTIYPVMGTALIKCSSTR